MSEDRLRIRCTCSQTLTVKKSDAGKVVQCPECSTKLRIPGATQTVRTDGPSRPSPSRSNPTRQAQAPAPVGGSVFDSASADDPFADVNLGQTDPYAASNPYAAATPTRGPAQAPGSTNPYAPTTQTQGQTPAQRRGHSGDEAIRNQYLSHEASLKSIGLLYFIGAVLIIPIGAIGMLFGLITLVQGEPAAIIMIIACLVYLAVGVGQFYLAKGIRNLNDTARTWIGVLAAPGLIGIPFGTLISAYIMYLCFSDKGKYVCSPEYRRIVANTPHIKYKTSIVVWIFLGLLVGIIALAMIAGLVAAIGGR